MADVKISGLPASTTPLAGTEVLPIVQGGQTRQVSVADLTAGRAVSASSLALTTTPLAVGSGGTGLTTLATGRIPYGNVTGAFNSSSALTYTATGLGVGVSASSIIDAKQDQVGTTLLTIQNRYHAPSTTQKVGIRLQLGDVSESFKYCEILAVPTSAYESAAAITFTTFSGSDPKVEAMRIFPTSGVSIGNTVDPGAKNLSVSGTISPQQATTAAAPAYVKGAIYFDTTLNKLRVGGVTGWETITST